MPSRFSRWTLLLILAACNLAFWLGAAVATGLLVSREVDLGLETLLRERQATAVVVWEETISKVPERLTPRTSTPSVPASGAPGQASTDVAETASGEEAEVGGPLDEQTAPAGLDLHREPGEDHEPRDHSPEQVHHDQVQHGPLER